MPQENFFSPDLFAFLQRLKRHNDREWFARNKAHYERDVRDPALAFITAFVPYLCELNPHFVADPSASRGSLFRIYRDVRFSPDKLPFKTHVGIRFSHERGKSIHAPVFYLHLEPDNCFAAAGVWHPDAPTLTKIRTRIAACPKDWKKARRGLELEGERLSRPPRGFNPHHELIDDIKFKDFVASIGFTDKQVCSSGFTQGFATACRKMLPLVEFTANALGLKF